MYLYFLYVKTDDILVNISMHLTSSSELNSHIYDELVLYLLHL